MKKEKKTYLKALAAYERGEPIMSDASFDKLEAEIRAKYPKWKGLRKLSARTSKTVTKLRQPMPSLDKVYPEEDFQRWFNRSKSQRVTVQHKLDGSSVLLTYEQGKPVQLVTRGNGKLGQDISYLIPYLNLPKIKHKDVLDIRCEAIMSRTNFARTKDYANPRNLVAGILGRDLDTSKESLEQLQLIDIVALSVVGDTVKSGLEKLKRYGYPHIVNTSSVIAVKDLTAAKLEQMLETARAKSDYDIDGLVVTYDVQVKYDSRNPKFAIAFKNNPNNEDVPVVQVLDVIWQVSPSGRLTPKIEIEPLDTGDAVVRHATAHNAQWLIDRGIGPGAEVRVLRSGDVIPKIVDVVKSGRVKLPEVQYEQRGVYFYATTETAVQQAKYVHRFLRLCGVENVAEGTILPLVTKHRRWARPSTWIQLAHAKAGPAQRYLTKNGVAGAKRPGLIYLELQVLRSIDIVNLLDAVNVFETLIACTQLQKFQQYAPLLPALKSKNIKKYVGQALEGKSGTGFGERNTEELIAGLTRFKERYMRLLELTEVTEHIEQVQEQQEGKYTGFVAAWTGYRSAEQVQYWEAHGGVTAKSISGRVTHVFYNPKGRFMDKVKAVGDRAYVWEEFV